MSSSPMPATADDLTDISFTPSQPDTNTAPGPTGVMAPPDQPAPAADPTASYPPSPDQGGPVPQSSPDPDAGSNTHGWRAVLRGALTGLENHLVGAGKGLVAGGIPGALVGAVNPAMADNAMKFRTQLQQAQVQKAQAQAQTAVEQAKFGAQDDPIQLAQAQLNLQHLTSLYNSTSPEFQQRLLGEGIEAGANLQRQGIQPVFVGDEADAAAHTQARIQTNDEAPLNTVMLPATGGKFAVYEIPSDAKTYSHPVEITIGHTADGQPIKQTFQPGQISIARSLALETAAMVDQSKTDAKVKLENAKAAGKVDVANATGVTNKNNAQANKANAQATAAPKTENLLVGSMPDGTQVAGTQQELQAAGASGITKLPTTEGSKVVVARQLVAPNGLFRSVAADLAALQKKGSLNVVGARWNEFMAGKVGAGDDDYTRLRTDTQLLSTAIM